MKQVGKGPVLFSELCQRQCSVSTNRRIVQFPLAVYVLGKSHTERFKWQFLGIQKLSVKLTDLLSPQSFC